MPDRVTSELEQKPDVEGVFAIQVPINYEDTDAGGVVYYGNYLGYMERARNAYLRFHGFPLTRLLEEHRLLFVVTDAKLHYFSPARLDDVLKVTLTVEKIGGASIVFEHQALRGEECLVHAEVKLATLNSDTFQPCRFPANLKSRLAEKYIIT